MAQLIGCKRGTIAEAVFVRVCCGNGARTYPLFLLCGGPPELHFKRGGVCELTGARGDKYRNISPRGKETTRTTIPEPLNEPGIHMQVYSEAKWMAAVCVLVAGAHTGRKLQLVASTCSYGQLLTSTVALALDNQKSHRGQHDKHTRTSHRFTNR